MQQIELEKDNHFYLKSNKLDFRQILISIFLMYVIVFPRDMINIKEILLCINIFIGLPAIIYMIKYKSKKNSFLIAYSLVFPVYIIVTSLVVGESSVKSVITAGYVWMMLLLIPIKDKYSLNIVKPIFYGITFIAILIDFIYLGDLLKIVSIYDNPVVTFFSKLDELHFGKGTLATFGYSIFFKTCPLIIFPYSYALSKRKWGWAGILFLAMLSSGTRANLIATIIVSGLTFVGSVKKNSTKFIRIIFIIILGCLFMPNLINKLSDLNKLKVNFGDDLKYESAITIINVLNENSLNYIFGTGVGSYFYFPARGEFVDVVELSYLDYFRQVGIIGFSIFIYFIIKPIRVLYKYKKWVVYAYILYLAIAFTNPLLMSSTAFIAYLLIYNYYFQLNQNLIEDKTYD